MRIFKLIIITVAALALFSCEPKYEKQYSWAYPLAGDWTLTAYVDDKAASDPFELKIYNSSFGQDSIWIDDYATTSSNGHFWSMKFKAKVDMTTKTFQSVGSKNVIPKYGIIIKVTDGKVIGNDSISMNIVFEDDATTTYKLAGHRTTSYEEYMSHD